MTSSTPSAGPEEAAALLAKKRRASAPSSSGLGTGLTGSANPETPKEAAEQFEKVLVRQFVDVMTEDMYSSSLAGDEGKQWMGSQRDRQRRVMTDMIANKLTDAGNLQISETLMQSWGIESSAEETDTATSPENSTPEFVDPLPASADPPSSQDRTQIDHVV